MANSSSGTQAFMAAQWRLFLPQQVIWRAQACHSYHYQPYTALLKQRTRPNSASRPFWGFVWTSSWCRTGPANQAEYFDFRALRDSIGHVLRSLLHVKYRWRVHRAQDHGLDPQWRLTLTLKASWPIAVGAGRALGMKQTTWILAWFVTVSTFSRVLYRTLGTSS